LTAWSFELENRLSELETLSQEVEAFGQEAGLSHKCVFQINLALDELFTNAVSYGFRDHDTHQIKFVFSLEGGTVIIRMENRGVPFDPDCVQPPDVKKTIETCDIGGLGLHITRQMVDDLAYERREGKNIITLRKHIEEDEWKSRKPNKRT
jgi:anti-sigma regulatory factor (Ser/Thr protein kinase)